MFLDRDGTLIQDRHFLDDPDDVDLLPGVPAGLKRLQDLDLQLVVVTNQSGVGRGYFDQATVQRIHNRIDELLAHHGVALDGYFVCPHHPDADCRCRKPRTAHLRAAADQFDAKLEDCFMIGDRLSDVQAGERVGACAFLLRTEPIQAGSRGASAAESIVRSFGEAAELIAKCILSVNKSTYLNL